MSPTPHKISHNVAGEWEEFSLPAVFERESDESGAQRLLFGVPGGDVDIVRGLLSCLDEPLYILYVLHTPRGEGAPGRYQSPKLSSNAIETFLTKYAAYLRGDARHDLWVHSPGVAATIVWDRHNRGTAYGPIDCFASALTKLGFSPALVPSTPAHAHHYRPEFDAEASRVLAEYDWRRTELEPGDHQ
jgi:hypothetical protein